MVSFKFDAQALKLAQHAAPSTTELGGFGGKLAQGLLAKVIQKGNDYNGSVRDIQDHIRDTDAREKASRIEKLIKKLAEEDRTSSSCKEIISKDLISNLNLLFDRGH